MHIADEEFFDKIEEIAIDKYILRCMICQGRFDANFNNGYNTHWSIKCNRTIPVCPICGNGADTFANLQNALDNDDEV